MSDKRQEIADETKDLLQEPCSTPSRPGILVTQVQLQRVDPPAAVIDAFNDVQRARADQERARNEAEAYSNDILPRARGEAEHIRQDAEAYKTQVVNLAEGDASAFLAVYQSYAGREGGDVMAAVSRQRRRAVEEIDQGDRRFVGQGRVRRGSLHAALRTEAGGELRPRRPEAQDEPAVDDRFGGDRPVGAVDALSSLYTVARASRRWWCGSARRSASPPSPG